MRRIRKAIKLSTTHNTAPKTVSSTDIEKLDSLEFNDWATSTTQYARQEKSPDERSSLTQTTQKNGTQDVTQTVTSSFEAYDAACKKLSTKLRLLSNRILRDLLKEEFKVTLGLSSSKETMVQEIISKLFSSSPSPKDNIMQKADILIYEWTIKQKEITNNSSDTGTSSSNTKVMPVLSFNNKQVTSYKQLTREEMYTHAIQYTTKYPKREYGSKSVYCKQNKITLDQLGRLLKQFDNGSLTGKETLARGRKSLKLTSDEIVSVITDIRSQRDAKKQISDKTIHGAITKITNKT
ncbi:predicted protein, partial [Naegleria gruberi]